LDDDPNFGLLLRWEAALAELSTFRDVPGVDVGRILRLFARAIEDRLQRDPAFEPLPTRSPDRQLNGVSAGWDRVPTIFPFLLRRPGPQFGHRFLGVEETTQVYRRLRDESAIELGQAVACGSRDGAPLSALRLCASARLVVEASANAAMTQVLIARALSVLDAAALLSAEATKTDLAECAALFRSTAKDEWTGEARSA
jgi:hypothetical protein